MRSQIVAILATMVVAITTGPAPAAAADLLDHEALLSAAGVGGHGWFEDDYTEYWLNGVGAAGNQSYTGPMADSVWQRYLVTGDRQFLVAELRLNPGGTVVNPNSGKCLDAVRRGVADNTRLQICDCSGEPNQQWSLT